MYTYANHERARQEAFGWYDGTPPSAEVARQHFAAEAERDPAQRALYAEALTIFLGTCWKLPMPSQEHFENGRV